MAPIARPGFNGGWTRSSVGPLSLATPCVLGPVSVPDPPDAAKVFTFSEHIGGEYAGCVMTIHHAQLRFGRDAYALDREIFSKTRDIGMTMGGTQIYEAPVLVNGTRGDRAAFSLVEGNVRNRMNRLTIAKNRDLWSIAVIAPEGNPSSAGVFEEMVKSIRL